MSLSLLYHLSSLTVHYELTAYSNCIQGKIEIRKASSLPAGGAWRAIFRPKEKPFDNSLFSSEGHLQFAFVGEAT